MSTKPSSKPLDPALTDILSNGLNLAPSSGSLLIKDLISMVEQAASRTAYCGGGGSTERDLLGTIETKPPRNNLPTTIFGC